MKAYFAINPVAHNRADACINAWIIFVPTRVPPAMREGER